MKVALHLNLISMMKFFTNLLLDNSFLSIVRVRNDWLRRDLTKRPVVLHDRVIIIRVAKIKPFIVNERMVWAELSVVDGKRSKLD
jgi:hypothetical protein